MATYSSGNVPLKASAETVYSKLSNLENLSSLLENIPADKVPADKLDMLRSIQISPDTISVPGGPVGALTFRLAQKEEPSLIKLVGENAPVPLSMTMHITPETPESCIGSVEIDISLPPMLKPMVGGHIQKAADQFAQVLRSIPFS